MWNVTGAPRLFGPTEIWRTMMHLVSIPRWELYVHGVMERKRHTREWVSCKNTEKRHQSLTDDVKTSSFFSEGNGFWLSIHPEDYARLIKPTDHDTILAIRTSADVSRWLEWTGTSSRSRQQWEDGWKTQDKSKKHIHEQPTSGNPPYSPSRPSMEDQKVQLASLSFCSSGNSVPYITNRKWRNLV